MQVVDPTPRLTLALEDLRSLPEDERDAEMHRRAAEEFERPFDLEAGPLVRARLVRLGDAVQVLLITAHHIVSDGWSTGVLVDDLVRIYDAYLHDRPSPLAPLSVQYADFASWQRQWLTGPVLDRQLDYWKRQLDGAPSVSELPTDRPRPAVQTFDGDTCTFALGPALSAGVKRLSERAGATTFMTMLAAFFVLLSRYTRQRDLVVGSPIAGRTRTELEPLVGFFLNTLVLRGDLSGDPTFRELVGRVRHAALDAYAHQDVPFEQIVEALQPERSTSVTPLFQIVFSGSTPDAAPIALPDVRVTPLGPARVFAKFDLTVGMGEKADEITGAFEYNTDLFDRPTMARMAAHYRAIVEAAVTSPDQPISSLPLLSADERRHVVSELNPAPEPAAPGATVPELVAAEAARRPDRPAVADASVRITYVELDCRANALAHRLRALGAGPETRVAVCAERLADLVVSLLGVLKSGAAYVPLDPDYPVDRLRFMLGDSGARVLVASAGIARPDLLAGLDRLAVVDAAGRDEAAAPPDGSDRSRQPRISHLHVRLDRPAQGRRGVAPRADEPRRVAQPRVRRHGIRSCDADREPRLRRLGVGNVAVPDGRRRAARRRRRHRKIAVGARPMVDRSRHHRELSADAARRAGARPRLDRRLAAAPADRRRPSARLGAAWRAVHARQQLRPHRKHRRRDVGHDSLRRTRRRAAADRSRDRGRRHLSRGRAARPGADRRARRDRRRRPQPRARLSRAPGSDRRSVRPRSVFV